MSKNKVAFSYRPTNEIFKFINEKDRWFMALIHQLVENSKTQIWSVWTYRHQIFCNRSFPKRKITWNNDTSLSVLQHGPFNLLQNLYRLNSLTNWSGLNWIAALYDSDHRTIIRPCIYITISFCSIGYQQ